MLTSSGRNIFTTAYILLLILGCFLLYNFTKPELELIINGYNAPCFDVFFKYFTYLGDGIFFAIATAAVLIYDYRKGILIILGGLLQMIIVRGLKWFVFPQVPRPSMLLAQTMPNYPVHYVEGEYLNSIDSIPSGHASTAFTLFTLLVLLIFYKKPLLSFICFLAAFLVAFSRVYLMQHFVFDVFFGSLIGVVSAFVVHQYLGKYILKKEKIETKIYSE